MLYRFLWLLYYSYCPSTRLADSYIIGHKYIYLGLIFLQMGISDISVALWNHYCYYYYSFLLRTHYIYWKHVYVLDYPFASSEFHMMAFLLFAAHGLSIDLLVIGNLWIFTNLLSLTYWEQDFLLDHRIFTVQHQQGCTLLKRIKNVFHI